MSRPSTAQRQMIQNLLRKAEFDARTVTLMHRNLGVSDSWIGRPVESWLDTLSIQQASDLIKKLQEEFA